MGKNAGVKRKRKLIEVALPLDAINAAAARREDDLGTAIRRRCTFGGLADRWPLVGRCCSLRWWTILHATSL